MGRKELHRASREELIEQVLTARSEAEAAQSRLEEAEHQLRWFKQQLFGAKSERRIVSDPSQLSLGEDLVEPTERGDAGTTVREHARRPRREKKEVDDPGLRFDDTVPVQRLVLEDPALHGLREGVDYTVVSEKKSHRLAQQPASYTVLEIVRPVVKLAETGKLVTPAAPSSVLPGSYADVSLLAGILVDKFRYHLPLYRQHQRLAAAGITLSRASLTTWVHRAVAFAHARLHRHRRHSRRGGSAHRPACRRRSSAPRPSRREVRSFECDRSSSPQSADRGSSGRAGPAWRAT